MRTEEERIRQTVSKALAQALLDAMSDTPRDARDALLQSFRSLKKSDLNEACAQFEKALSSFPSILQEWEQKHGLVRMHTSTLLDREDYIQYRYTNGLILTDQVGRVEVGWFIMENGYANDNKVVPLTVRKAPRSVEDLDACLCEARKWWQTQRQWHLDLSGKYQSALDGLAQLSLPGLTCW